MTHTIRGAILDIAKELTTKDRQEQYGSARDNFGSIAMFWTEFTGNTITAEQVPVMLALMKVARLKSNPTHQDSFVDACGYMALAGELGITKNNDQQTGQ